MRTQTCSKECDEVKLPDMENINVIEHCSRGKVFCLSTQTCENECDQTLSDQGAYSLSHIKFYLSRSAIISKLLNQFDVFFHSIWFQWE